MIVRIKKEINYRNRAIIREFEKGKWVAFKKINRIKREIISRKNSRNGTHQVPRNRETTQIVIIKIVTITEALVVKTNNKTISRKVLWGD